MNTYKYGSIEYDLEDAKKSIDKAIGSISKLKTEVGQIKQINSIYFGKSFYAEKARIEGNPNNSIESFGNFSGNYFDSFNPEKKEHIERCYNNVLDFIEKSAPKIEEWHKVNLPDIEYNKKLAQSVANFMQIVGFPTQYKDRDYKSKSVKPKYITHTAGYIQDITRSIKTSDGYETAKKQLVDLKIRADKWREEKLKNIQKIEQEKAKSDKQIRLIAKALELYKEYGLTNKYETNDQLVAMVTDIASEKYRQEYDGHEFSIKCCDGCSTWVCDEPRCSCGNRRMELTVDGNILDGFTCYPEPY